MKSIREYSSSFNEKTQRFAAYTLLSVGAILGVWFVGHNSAQSLKDSINKAVTNLCVASIPNAKKVRQRDLVQIEIQEDAKTINLKRGDTARVKLNNKAIKSYQNSLSRVPTVKQCKQHIIP